MGTFVAEDPLGANRGSPTGSSPTRRMGLAALAVAVAVTLLSGADYFVRFWKDVMRGTGRAEEG